LKIFGPKTEPFPESFVSTDYVSLMLAVTIVYLCRPDQIDCPILDILESSDNSASGEGGSIHRGAVENFGCKL
jgi:hypothetical protein